MLSIRKRIKKANRHYSLRKKVNGLKKNCNDKKIYSWFEDSKQKNDHLNVIMLFPNKA
ncbi:MAG TPA: hypothetical protein VGH95_03740 [Candidatus Aquirickettsiella sp.]|jgi:hypothetical protein